MHPKEDKVYNYRPIITFFINKIQCEYWCLCVGSSMSCLFVDVQVSMSVYGTSSSIVSGFALLQ